MNQKLKDFKNFCEKCPKRNTCIKLCAAAEAYASQDYVSQKELTVVDIEKIKGKSWGDLIPTEIELDIPAWISLARNTKMTKRQKKYLYLSYWKRKSKAEIARKFGTSRQNVCQIIKRVKVEIEKNNMIIYKATNKINGKIYIGQTIKSLKERKRNHIHNAFKQKGEVYFYKALRKHGKENFKWEVIDRTDTVEKLNELEAYYIKKYNTFGKDGYNSTTGGEGYIVSEETKQKIRDHWENHDSHWSIPELPVKGVLDDMDKDRKYKHLMSGKQRIKIYDSKGKITGEKTIDFDSVEWKLYMGIDHNYFENIERGENK